MKKQGKRTRARECGWSNAGNALERAIPYYDAVDDKYCTITRKPQFQRHLRKTQRGASRDYLRAVQKLRSQHAILNPLIQATGVGAVTTAMSKDSGSDFLVFGQESRKAHAAIRYNGSAAVCGRVRVTGVVFVGCCGVGGGTRSGGKRGGRTRCFQRQGRQSPPRPGGARHIGIAAQSAPFPFLFSCSFRLATFGLLYT